MNIHVRFEWLIVLAVLAGGTVWAQGPSAPAPIQLPPANAYYGGSNPNFIAPPNLYDELLPQAHGGAFDNDSRLDLSVREMFRGSWLRLEYLQGYTQRDDSRVLGSPIDVADPAPLGGPAQDVANVANQFLVIFADSSNLTTGTASAYAQVPTTKGVSWHDAQGMRGSFGIPVLDAVWLEAGFWGYANQRGQLRTPPIPANSPFANGDTEIIDSDGNVIPQGPHYTNITTFLATTLTTDGVPGSRLILYDAGFASSYESRLRAGSVDLVLNWKAPELGWRAQPIIGYRHEQYDETLAFGGAFDNRSGYLDGIGVLATPETNFISSKVINQRDQIQFGMRNELALRFVTLGLQEKFAIGSNVVRGTVNTSDLREPGTIPGSLDDPDWTNSTDRRVVVAPTFDLDVYAKIRMTSWMNLRVGYSLIVMGNLGVADQSLRLNEVSDGAGGTIPDVTSQLRFGHRVVSALTVGGEIVLP